MILTLELFLPPPFFLFPFIFSLLFFPGSGPWMPPALPIRRRSYVIIGFVAPAIGPNKSKKLTRLISRHTIYAAKFEWKTTYTASQTMSRVACRWEGESVNHGRGNCYARRSRRINTLSCVHPLNRTTGPLLAWWHLEERCLEALCITTQISRGFIRTSPCVVCAGDVSRVSFLDLFGPVAIQLCNHFSGE